MANDLILPSSYKREKKLVGKDRSYAMGVHPWNQATKGPPNTTLKKGSWNDYYAMFLNHTWVRAAIVKIAKTATNTGYDFVPRDSRASVRTGEVAKLQKFFRTQPDFMSQLRKVYMDMLICGDGYLYIVPTRKGEPHRLKRLHPNTIAVRASTNGEITSYVQFDPNDLGNQDYVLYEPHEIIHVKMDDPDNDLYGLSPLETLKLAVVSDIYAQKFNAAFFMNSGMTGTIIAVKGADPDEIDRNRQFLVNNYSGPESAHQPLFLEGDNVTVSKAVVSQTDMAFLDGRKFIITEIFAVLDIPPVKMGIMESANRSNSKEQDKSFRSESLAPLQKIVEDAINGQFIVPILGIENTMFKHSETDARDNIEMMDYYTSGIAWGIFNVDEVRAEMGKGVVEGGNINGIMAPTGFVPLDRMHLYFQIPKQNIEDVPEHPDDPATGEKTPKQVAAITGVAKSMYQSIDPAWKAAYTGAMYIAKGATPTKQDTINAYIQFEEASHLHPRFASTYKFLQKAVTEEKELISRGYVERAKRELGEYFSEVGHNAE